MTYAEGKFTDAIGLSDGEIDCIRQQGEQIGLTLDANVDANGNYPILGQCFSEQIG